MVDKPILDACCGPKMFYFDKKNPLVEFVDIREGDFSCHGRKIIVEPDTVADFRNLPYQNERFNLVIFDPPHLKSAGKTSYMRAKYGQLPTDWKDYISEGFVECWRVLKKGGTLVFKWSEAQIPLKEVLEAIPQQPLIGNRGTGRTKPKTHWLVFFKPEWEG